MFGKITPEQAGISSLKVAEFINKLNKRKLRMHSVLMMKGDKLFAEYYWTPFHEKFCHRMYSQTKSYVSVAIGLLEEEGKLSLDDTIASYFPEKIHTELTENLKKQTIREMLTMCTVGSGIGWWFMTDYEDRTELYFNERKNGTPKPSGTLWDYDSQGSQVLSNLVEKLSGMTLFEYLNEKIFKHLGTFKTAEILKTRNGDSWGDSALICRPRDMASFARFVMNYGVWNGKRLMNEEYLRTATSALVDNSQTSHYSVYHSQGYGYQIWRIEQNGFLFVGMGGQLTACFPDKDLIFVCTGDNQGRERAYDTIFEALLDIIVDNINDFPLPEAPADYKALCDATSNLKLFSAKGLEDSSFRNDLNGVRYTLENNPMGISEFTFYFNDKQTGELHYKNAQGEKILPFGVNHNVFGKFPQLGYSNGIGGARTDDGFMYNDAVSLAWLDEKEIMICVQIIDKYFGNASMFFAFKDDEAVVRMIKSAEDFLDEYQGFTHGKREN